MPSCPADALPPFKGRCATATLLAATPTQSIGTVTPCNFWGVHASAGYDGCWSKQHLHVALLAAMALLCWAHEHTIAKSTDRCRLVSLVPSLGLLNAKRV